MDRDEVVDWLKQYHDIIREIRELDEDAAYLRTRLYSASKPSLDGLPRSNYNADRTASQVAKLADMDIEITRLLDDLYRRRQEIEKAIDSLGGDERRIVRLRYIACRADGRGYTWWEIGEQAGYTDRQSQRLHRQAVEKMSHYVAV